MTTAQWWLVTFMAGIAVFMLGVLVPRRELQVVGAIVSIVGGLGWIILALTD